MTVLRADGKRKSVEGYSPIAREQTDGVGEIVHPNLASVVFGKGAGRE
ncbi:hypothetical protein [Salibaculum sp.]|nr:hypothetical protein [Salibaculum sp.]HKL68461.1 hypothetical protein [Salibaculum sp.]